LRTQLCKENEKNPTHTGQGWRPQASAAYGTVNATLSVCEYVETAGHTIRFSNFLLVISSVFKTIRRVTRQAGSGREATTRALPTTSTKESPGIQSTAM